MEAATSEWLAHFEAEVKLWSETLPRRLARALGAGRVYSEVLKIRNELWEHNDTIQRNRSEFRKAQSEKFDAVHSHTCKLLDEAKGWIDEKYRRRVEQNYYQPLHDAVR